MQNFVARFNLGDVDHIADERAEIWSQLGITSQPAWAFVNDDGSIGVQLGELGEEGLIASMEALAKA